jgi:hypothetical protein
MKNKHNKTPKLFAKAFGFSKEFGGLWVRILVLNYRMVVPLELFRFFIIKYKFKLTHKVNTTAIYNK